MCVHACLVAVENIWPLWGTGEFACAQECVTWMLWIVTLYFTPDFSSIRDKINNNNKQFLRFWIKTLLKCIAYFSFILWGYSKHLKPFDDSRSSPWPSLVMLCWNSVIFFLLSPQAVSGHLCCHRAAFHSLSHHLLMFIGFNLLWYEEETAKLSLESLRIGVNKHLLLTQRSTHQRKKYCFIFKFCYFTNTELPLPLLFFFLLFLHLFLFFPTFKKTGNMGYDFICSYLPSAGILFCSCNN